VKHLITSIFIIVVFGSCKTPEARRPISSSSGTTIDASILRNKKLIANQESQIRDIISKDSSNTYETSSNGFWYYFKTQDTTSQKMPEFGDLVSYDYSIESLNGATIYSDEETPSKTYAMDQEQLASGIREGLKLTTEGDEIVLLLPSHKAYGYYGDKNKIGSNIPITVKLKVNSITTQYNPQE
jgi:gliding motility-associated peptidyl-prolyl isomerase